MFKKLYTKKEIIKFSLCFCLVIFSNFSLSESFFDAGESSVKIISESDNVKENDSLLLGLVFELEEGWHTYWKNPGDSGEGASIKWELPKGFKTSPVLWPGPEKIPFDPLMTYGYENKVILLTEIQTPKEFSESIKIIANVNWLTCKEICIPQEGQVELTLKKGPKISNGYAARLNEVALTVPKPYPLPFRVKTLDKKIFLQFERQGSREISEAYFFPDEYGLIDYAAKQKLEKNDNSFSLELTPTELQVNETDLKGVLKVNNGTLEEFYRIEIPLDSKATQPLITMTLFTGIIFAFLGGIILNAMPCVFPILSIKILGFIEHSQGSKEKLFHHGVIFSAGVLTTFLAISSLLIFLRASGEAIGWGYQLQSPWVVSLLIYLFVAIGIVFMGNIVFGSKLANFGVLAQNRKDLMSSFFTGVLAVIVASPCTAPFMGPALGLALLQPGFKSVVIFLALGLGFSLPYLLLSIYPQLLSKLPKPGEWMQTLKQVMAFPMWASALWLAWVLSAQVDMQSVFAVLLGALFIALGLWLIEKTQNSETLLRRISIGISASLLMLSIWLIPTNDDNDFNLSEDLNSFSTEKLNSLREQQKAIFINFTADWCITCKVNESIALDQKAVKKLLDEKNIVYLKADWTKKDPEIASILTNYGRTGVPLYLLFPPVGEAIILPELLTEDLLLDFLNKIN